MTTADAAREWYHGNYGPPYTLRSWGELTLDERRYFEALYTAARDAGIEAAADYTEQASHLATDVNMRLDRRALAGAIRALKGAT